MNAAHRRPARFGASPPEPEARSQLTSARPGVLPATRPRRPHRRGVCGTGWASAVSRSVLRLQNSRYPRHPQISHRCRVSTIGRTRQLRGGHHGAFHREALSVNTQRAGLWVTRTRSSDHGRESAPTLPFFVSCASALAKRRATKPSGFGHDLPRAHSILQELVKSTKRSSQWARLPILPSPLRNSGVARSAHPRFISALRRCESPGRRVRSLAIAITHARRRVPV